MSDYRKLAIWRRARALSIRVHKLVGKLERVEQFRRGDQLIRAAKSIRHNIAEGSGLGTPPQFAKFLRSSIASANEVEDELQELHDVGLLPPEDFELIGEASEIAAMTFSFRRTVLRNNRRRPRAENESADQ